MKLLMFLTLLGSQIMASEKPLSFVEFLELARKNDPNLSLILADKERTKFLADLELPAEQLLLKAQSEYGVGVTVDGNTSKNSATLTKNFTSTGTTLSIGYTSNDLATGNEEITEFTLEQSLYKNLFGKYTRLQKKALEKEVESLSMQVVETYEGYLTELGLMYLDYSQAWHNVELAKQILKETKSIKENIEKKHKNNIASQTDLNRAQLQVTLRREDLIRLESQLESLAAGLASASNLSELKITPALDSFSAMLPRVDLDGIQFEDLRVAKIASYDKYAAKKRVILADGLNDPNVNFIAGYNIDESSRFSSNVNREEQVFGLELEIPFGNTRNHALLKEARLAKTKSEIKAFAQKKDSLKSFKVLKMQLVKAKEILSINTYKVKLSEKVYNGDYKRYRYGNVTLDRLIETKNTYSLHRYELFASTVNYYKLALQWLNLSDKLINKL